MDARLATAKWQYAFVYIENIIIISRTLKEHLQHIEIVLKLPNSPRMIIKLNKCFFCVESASVKINFKFDQYLIDITEILSSKYFVDNIEFDWLSISKLL